MCPYGALTAPCSAQRVVVDGKIVSQLCDENGTLHLAQFQQAMRKQVRRRIAPRCCSPVSFLAPPPSCVLVALTLPVRRCILFLYFIFLCIFFGGADVACAGMYFFLQLQLYAERTLCNAMLQVC